MISAEAQLKLTQHLDIGLPKKVARFKRVFFLLLWKEMKISQHTLSATALPAEPFESSTLFSPAFGKIAISDPRMLGGKVGSSIFFGWVTDYCISV